MFLIMTLISTLQTSIDFHLRNNATTFYSMRILHVISGRMSGSFHKVSPRLRPIVKHPLHYNFGATATTAAGIAAMLNALVLYARNSSTG